MAKDDNKYRVASRYAGTDPRGDMFSGMEEEELKKSLENFDSKGMAYYDDIKSAIEDINPENPMPIALIYAIIDAESNFNPNAGSAAGAKGLMQFMPSNYKGGRYKHDPTIPSKSIYNGVKFINDLLDGRYKPPAGDISKSLYGYNTGQNRESLKTKTFDELPHGGGKYASGGKTYVNKILSNYDEIIGGSIPKKSGPKGKKREVSPDGKKVALIGDSNAFTINQHYENDGDFMSGDDVQNHALGGFGVNLKGKSWLKILNMLKAGKVSAGSPREMAKAAQLIKFDPDTIIVTNLGGNDTGAYRKDSEKYLKDAKKLMRIVKEYNGSYAGAAAVMNRYETRQALNNDLEKLAPSVGIPFHNPTKDAPYLYAVDDFDEFAGADKRHMGTELAKREYEARKDSGFYGRVSKKGKEEVANLKPEPFGKSPYDKSLKAKDILSYFVDEISTVPKRKALFVQWMQNEAGQDQVLKGLIPPFDLESFERVLADFKDPKGKTQTNPDDITSSVRVAQRWIDILNPEEYTKSMIPGDIFEQGNNKMKITKERLAQIIKEEVEAYKASQLNEVDIDELEEAEAYIKEIADLLKSTYETFFRGAAPAVGTPQTKADTGEPVTDQTAHEDAKGLLLDLLGDAIDEFQQKEPELNEDGHDDVPSAVRAMKTIAEDAMEMLQALEQMDGSLPTWWTNKMAVSASMLNKMRDYLLVPSMEEEMDEQ